RMLTGFRGEVEVAERSEIRRKLLGLYGTSFSRLLAAREHQDPSSLPGELWDAAWRDMARLSAQTLRLSELDGAGTMQVTAWGKSWSEQIPAPLGRALAQELLRKLGITPGARPEAHRFRMPTLRLGVDCSVRPNPRGGTIFARTFKLDWLPDGPLARSPGGVAYAAVQPAYDLMERANEAWEEGDSERAEAEGRRALELADTPFGRTEPGFLELRAQVGMTAFLRGDYRGALAEQSVALERHAELLGLPDLGSARFQRWAGQSLLALGHVERARELITRALQTYEALVSPPDATLVAPLIDAGLCAWAHGGDLEAARVFFARARDSLPAAGPFTDEMSRRITRLLSRLEEGGPAPTGVAALMRDD
ncbi:MAG: hypothetical protein JNK04_15870, partial [Myxococcales bacterium]|nr:hypothetical protein [Myxococcales bacterium]